MPLWTSITYDPNDPNKRPVVPRSNKVRTSKYTLLTFFPKSFFGQFRRFANLYFFGQCVLMVLGQYTNLFQTSLNAWSVTATLLVVMGVTMVMEAKDDLGRHRKDREINEGAALGLSAAAGPGASLELGAGGGGLRVAEKTWQAVQVGDLVLVRDNDQIPADMVLLASSNEEGVCYVETSNIDGEINLKIRTPDKAISDFVQGGLARDGGGPGGGGPGGGGGAPAFPAVGAGPFRGGVANAGITVQCEEPNPKVDHFRGVMTISTDGTQQQQQSGGGGGGGGSGGGGGGSEQLGPVRLDEKQLLLRGSFVRQTSWALGVCVYTGHQTKVMMNARVTPSKMSNLEHVVNKMLAVVVFTQCALVSLTTVMCYFWEKQNLQPTPQQSFWFIYPEGSTVESYLLPGWLANWLNFFILFNNIVPINLYVTMEICNVLQGVFINTDLHMWDATTDTPAKTRSTNLCQELGQIQYIFSDKTGTLTQNIMVFRAASIGGAIYGSLAGDDQPMPPAENSAGDSIDGSQGGGGRGGGDGNSPSNGNSDDGDHGAPPVRSEADLTALAAGTARRSGKDEAALAADFLAILAVAHTIVVKRDEETGELEYQAESPDEKALVEAAARLGYRFLRRSGDKLVVQRGGGNGGGDGGGNGEEELEYTILALNSFSSSRKRMSVVARLPDGSLRLFCKGADNIIFERLTSRDAKGAAWSQVARHLDRFSCDGLRTLVLAQRKLSQAEFDAWAIRYNAARVAMDDGTLLAEAAEAIETELELVGATAIEDKLQDGVPQTIADLAEAQIKLWVLTGDKLQTAVNIGHACRLLDHSMAIFCAEVADDVELGDPKQEAEAKTELEVTLLNALAHLTRPAAAAAAAAAGSSSAADRPSVEYEADDESKRGSTTSGGRASTAASGSFLSSSGGGSGSGSGRSQRAALVITGKALSLIMADTPLRKLLLDIGLHVDVVIACRVSPAQKAELVDLVRKGVKPTPITLAIGDGANDCPMIQAAHVGVGISGQEGRQAFNASDFGIAQFRFLHRLLLVHGRWNYRRMCKVIVYVFYKNFCVTLCMFYFTFLSAFSGQSVFEEMMYTGFNLFTMFSIIAVGIADQDVRAHTAQSYPALYLSGRLNLDLNVKVILEAIASALLHSVFSFLFPFMAYDGFDQDSKGGLFVWGSVVFTSLLYVVTHRVIFVTKTWNLVTALGLVAGFVLWFCFLGTYPLMWGLSRDFYMVSYQFLVSPLYWIIAFGGAACCLCLDYLAAYCRRECCPNIIDLAVDIDALAEPGAFMTGGIRGTLRKNVENAVSGLGVSGRGGGGGGGGGGRGDGTFELDLEGGGSGGAAGVTVTGQAVEDPQGQQQPSAGPSQSAPAERQGGGGGGGGGGGMPGQKAAVSVFTAHLVNRVKSSFKMNLTKRMQARRDHEDLSQLEAHHKSSIASRGSVGRGSLRGSMRGSQAAAPRIDEDAPAAAGGANGGEEAGRRPALDSLGGSLRALRSPWNFGGGGRPSSGGASGGQRGSSFDESRISSFDFSSPADGAPRTMHKLSNSRCASLGSKNNVASSSGGGSGGGGEWGHMAAAAAGDGGEMKRSESAGSVGSRAELLRGGGGGGGKRGGMFGSSKRGIGKQGGGGGLEAYPNKPKGYRLYQQTLPSRQCHLTEHVVAAVVGGMALFLILFGALMYTESVNVVERGVRYDGGEPRFNQTGADATPGADGGDGHNNASMDDGSGGAKPPPRRRNPFRFGSGMRNWPSQCVGLEKGECTVRIPIDVDMPGPINVYYVLTSFHQNARTFVKSLDYAQLAGESVKPADSDNKCASTSVDNSSLEYAVQYGNASQYALPCGLQTASFFNDTFTWLNASTVGGNGTEKRTTTWGVNATLDETGIAWPTDLEYKFKNPEGYPHEVCGDGNEAFCLYQMYPEIVTKDEGVKNEHYVVWMRLNALPAFRKLYGRVHETIPAGSVVEIKINSQFPVHSFNGTKAIVISSQSWAGANLMGVGVCYMMCGLAALAIAFAVIIKRLVKPRMEARAKDRLMETKRSESMILSSPLLSGASGSGSTTGLALT